MHLTRLLSLSLTVALCPLLITSCATDGGGSGAAHGPSFAHSLGSATAKDSGGRCSIGLSAPSGSALKSQKINFVLEHSDSLSWTTREFPVATGSSKTLGELQAQLGGALQRGLTAGAGTELTKVGNIAAGGEVRLVARGGGSVLFDYKPALDGGNPVLTPGETAAFAQLLGR